MSKSQLKIGVLVSSLQASEINVDLVRQLADEDSLNVSLVVLDTSRPLEATPLPRRRKVIGSVISAINSLRRIQIFTFVVRLHDAIACSSNSTKEKSILALSKTTLDLIAPVEHYFRPLVSPSGFVQRLNDTDLDALRSGGFDVLVRLGNGILRGGILTASRHGILSFHHGDNRVNRGGPWGYWEVVNKEASSGFILQRLTDELDGGDVLVRRNYQTFPTVTGNRENLALRSYPVLLEVLLQLAASDRLPDAEPPFPYDGPILRTPNKSSLARLLFSTFDRKRKAVLSQFRSTPNLTWRVGVATKPWSSVSLRAHHPVPTPAGSWVADPFLVEHQGSRALFVEEFVVDRRRGRISVCGLDETARPGPPHPVIEEEFHLSFPSTFRFGDELFMTPETYDAREVRLYRCVEFPDKWEFVRSLLSGVAAVDPMIVEHDGNWFMLVNIDPLDRGDPNSELHVFWADDPVSGAWHPLRNNPQIADPRQARNGGLLRDGTRLFRVGQRQSFGVYGDACGIYEITRLDREVYSEILRFPMSAKWAPGLRGPHHFSSLGNLTAFDYQATTV